MDKPNKLEDFLHLVEFAYSNCNQKSTKKINLRYSYARRCNTTFSWDNLVDMVMLRLDMLKEMEQEVNKAKKI